jgi:hypothetical protein
VTRRAKPRTIGRAVLVGILLTSLAAAGSDVPPRRRRALLRWLKAGAYRERFVGEPEVHPSTARGHVHGANVRTYYNPILVDDLRAGRITFRMGAAMVKELYFDNVDRLVGYSVMVKVRPRTGISGRGWLFYETLDGTNRAASFGRGLGLCTGCHRSGVDFLRSGFRP